MTLYEKLNGFVFNLKNHICKFLHLMCISAEHSEGNGVLRNYHPDFLPPQTSVDNPEYHLVAAPVLGIPHAHTLINTPTVQANSGVPQPQQKSSEEESDHEYYNDFDRLQRELQPLRRNETTV